MNSWGPGISGHRGGTGEDRDEARLGSDLDLVVVLEPVLHTAVASETCQVVIRRREPRQLEQLGSGLTPIVRGEVDTVDAEGSGGGPPGDADIGTFCCVIWGMSA